MFNPISTELGPTNENVSFSETITYVDNLQFPPINATVVLTALDNNPDSIVISGNTISGYYYDSFEKEVQYRTPDNRFITLDNFTDIDKTNLSEMIYYHPSLLYSRIYSYRADAYNNGNIIATKTYTMEVLQDWTSGMETLKEYVSASTKQIR
jgi:hypothetical protein